MQEQGQTQTEKYKVEYTEIH